MIRWPGSRRELTVKDKKKRKKTEQRKEKLAGKVKTDEDKEWLAEVCPLDEKHGGTWLDRSQDRLGWSVCRATLWFDGLFGDERAIAERDATYGYVQPKLDYNEEDGVDPDARFRAKFNLPLADRRFNALLGRNDDDDDQHGETDRRTKPAASSCRTSFRDADDDWLVGLGYSPVRGSRKRLDFDAGVELRSPVDVFVQGRYRRHWFLSARDLVRAAPDRVLAHRRRPRHADQPRLRARPLRPVRDALAQRRDLRAGDRGRRVVRTRSTLFQRLGLKTALAYELSADGETDDEVPVKNYGFELIYRRNILREWLFLELRPGARLAAARARGRSRARAGVERRPADQLRRQGLRIALLDEPRGSARRRRRGDSRGADRLRPRPPPAPGAVCPLPS